MDQIGIIVIAGLLIVFLTISSVRVAREYQNAIVFRLGRYVRTRGPGVFLVAPFIENSRVIDMRPITVVIEPQDITTRDSVRIKAGVAMRYKIVEPHKAMTEVPDCTRAVLNLAAQSHRPAHSG